jgi:hypothetical protein
LCLPVRAHLHWTEESKRIIAAPAPIRNFPARALTKTINWLQRQAYSVLADVRPLDRDTSEACAAASRATGTRKGEQDT